jgi:hypothetical protein
VRETWVLLSLVACSYSPPAAIGDGGSDAPDHVSDVPTDGGGRITAGLTGLWKFDDNGGVTGTVVSDSSMQAPPVNPTIADVNRVMWFAQGLEIQSSVTISTPVVANRLVAASNSSEQVTLEAWVTPASDMQTGTVAMQPARIVTFAPANGSNHHISIGQDGASWVAGVRTTAPGIDVHGNPALSHPIAGTLAHIVVTADASKRRLYVNGDLATEDDLGGQLNWDPNRAFVLAGEPNGQNPWLGSFHLVAMYDRALAADEVMTNFLIGARP